MKLLVDMNLSPSLVGILKEAGHEALHWSTVGDPRAADHVILEWARQNGCVVLTHDLDFGALLALTQAGGPSVIQVRTDDITPRHLGLVVPPVLERFASYLEAGALVTLDENRARVRVLPLGPES